MTVNYEIERRFISGQRSWDIKYFQAKMVQGYVLIEEKQGILRVRTEDTGGQKSASWGYKGKPTPQGTLEIEEAITLSTAEELLKQCGERTLNKVRYHVPHEGLVWHVDVFAGRLKPLVIAKIELATPKQSFVMPPWAGEEITGRYEYSNAQLATHGLPAHFHA